MTWHAVVVAAESPELYPGDIKSVLLGEEQIQTRIAELGAQIGADYRELAVGEDQDLLLITVLKGAVMFVTDLARAIPLPTQFEFMAVSSYGSSTSSSGVVRILKDLDRDINDRDVLIVEDVVDSGLTLSWLLRNLATRHPHSLRVCTLLRKPELEYALRHADVTVLITVSHFLKHAYTEILCEICPALAHGGQKLAAPQLPALRHVIVQGGTRPNGALEFDALLHAGARLTDEWLARHASR